MPLWAPARKNSISGDSFERGKGREPTVIEIVLLISSRSANSGELFAGSRSSERRIKGERVRRRVTEITIDIYRWRGERGDECGRGGRG